MTCSLHAAFRRLRAHIAVTPLHGFLQDVLHRAAAEEEARQAVQLELTGCIHRMHRRRRQDARDKLRILKELVIRLGDLAQEVPEGAPGFEPVNHWGLRPVERPDYVPGEWAPLGRVVQHEGEGEDECDLLYGRWR